MTEERREQPRGQLTNEEEFREATKRRSAASRLIGTTSQTLAIQEVVKADHIPEEMRRYTQSILDQTISDPELHQRTTDLLDQLNQASVEARSRVSDFVRASNSRIMLIAVRRYLKDQESAPTLDEMNERIRVELMLGHVPLTLEQLEDDNRWMSLSVFQRFFAVCVKLVPVPNAIRRFALEFKRQGYGPADVFIKALANMSNFLLGPLMMPQLNRTGAKTIEDVLKLFNGNKDKPMVKFGNPLPPVWHQARMRYDWLTIDVQLKPELGLDPIRDDGWSLFGGLIAGPFRHVVSVLGASDAHGFVLDYPTIPFTGPPEPSWEVCFPGDPMAIIEFFQEWRRLCPLVGIELAVHREGNTIIVNGEPTLRRVVVTHDDGHEFTVELVTDDELNEVRRNSPVWIATRSVAWGESYDEDLFVPVFKRGVLYGMPFLRLRGWYEFPPLLTKIGRSIWNLLRYSGQFLRHPIAAIPALIRYGREFMRGELRELDQELVKICEQIDRYHLEALATLDSVLADTARIREATGEAKQALIEKFIAEYRCVGQDTMGHVERVEVFALGVTDLFHSLFPYLQYLLNREHIELAARFHDWGKLFIHPDVLNKPGKPELWEFDYMKAHINGTIFLLRLCEFLLEIIEIAGNHHQRANGTGYPAVKPMTTEDGQPVLDEEGNPVLRPLFASEMSFGALLMIPIDVWDAMRARRRYKDPLPRKVVINTVKQACGQGHYAPIAAALFLCYAVPTDEPEATLIEQELADIRSVFTYAKSDPEAIRFGINCAILETYFEEWLASTRR